MSSGNYECYSNQMRNDGIKQMLYPYNRNLQTYPGLILLSKNGNLLVFYV